MSDTLRSIKRTQRAIYILSLIALALGAFLYIQNLPPPAHKYDALAQCIASTDTKFYGAFWCPHCAEQKNDFGTGAQYLPYVECSTPDARGETQACQTAGITEYPTWVFPDGSELKGVTPVSTLAAKTGCPLPTSTAGGTIDNNQAPMTPFVQAITNLLSTSVLVLDIFAVILFIILISPLKRRGAGKKIADFCGERALLLSFIVALASVGGSLFFSDVAGFQPCLLCWWQRIFLYPQAVILLVALIKKDYKFRLNAIVLSAIGAVVSTYHTFIQFGVTPLTPCSASGVSCQVVYFLQYGYVTIPTMALTAFVLILLFMSAPNPLNREIKEI